MTLSLIDPNDPLERQNEKLLKIAESLMRRVEESTDASGAAYAQFQRAAMLEQEVRARTLDLERALDLLNESNARLAQANRETEAARSNLANAIETVQEGFALFNADEELVMCNSRFGMHMPDIRSALSPGLSFAQYVELVSQSSYLSLPDTETPQEWARRRMARHADEHVIFNVRMIWNRWVQVSEHRTPDGGTVILQTDVTDIMRIERQERERILDDQARLIRATLEHIDQGLCIFDSKLRLVGWNKRASELLAIPAARFQMGAQFATLFNRFRTDVTFDDGMNADAVEAWVGSDNNRPPLSFEIHRGRSTILSVFAQEMPDRGFVISFTDVTAERQAAQAIIEAKEQLEQRVADRTAELAEALKEAERANATKSRFVAAASHDLLQPLSAAKLYVSSLENGAAGEAERGIAHKASSALGSVEHILEALLDISKLDSGRASVHVSPVQLGGMLQQLGDAFGPAASAKGLDLRIVSSSALVQSDATYLRRILQNLISNAIRYTDAGRVLIGARRQGDHLLIEVRDTGPGIPDSARDTIFQEFQRLDAAASAAEGMGLGLAIVERACALLGHPLTLVSQEGRGSVFSVRVPLVASGGQARAHPDAQTSNQTGDLQSLIALVIENEDSMRAALTMALETWGVQVLACASEDEASTLLQEIGVGPDVIIADYQLDDGHLGTEAASRISDDFGRLPVCIISADRSVELTERCNSQGFALIHKPIDTNKLLAFLLNCAPGQVSPVGLIP
ncbi:PAS-domain containing protein [Roseovarius sp. MMSF_3281]|uniref:hybrid sensor histidine kinase/response regulator n=1 Tax=Roseovarius sp. MMSF_3281 TaxID=3046694 RepID=UPI00273E53F7|nr:PAS-domain containing protein [Roseovarius sp. MMSF_3281]